MSITSEGSWTQGIYLLFPSEIAIFKEKEDSVVDDPPESYEQVIELIAEGILHESHHRIFQILEILSLMK